MIYMLWYCQNKKLAPSHHLLLSIDVKTDSKVSPFLDTMHIRGGSVEMIHYRKIEQEMTVSSHSTLIRMDTRRSMLCKGNVRISKVVRKAGSFRVANYTQIDSKVSSQNCLQYSLLIKNYHNNFQLSTTQLSYEIHTDCNNSNLLCIVTVIIGMRQMLSGRLTYCSEI